MRIKIICILIIMLIVINMSPSGKKTDSFNSKVKNHKELNEFQIPNNIVVSCSFDKPIFKTITISEEQFSSIKMNDLQSSGNVGSPRLPLKSVNILLPPMSYVTNINIEGEMNEIKEEYLVEPIIEPIIISSQRRNVDLFLNSTIYNSSELFPGEAFTNAGIGYFRGYAILTLLLHPIQYIPKSGKVFYYDKLTVTINTEINGERNSLYRYCTNDKNEVKKKVVNPMMTDIYDNAYHSETTVSNKEEFKYVIITHHFFENEFQQLIDHKSHFISAKMVYTLWIASIYPGNDTQERIRNFIIDAYQNWGTEYILLGGDDDIIPNRGLYGELPNSDEHPGGVHDNIPADLYFAGLDGDWDDNENGIYGEYYWDFNTNEFINETDLYAEVYIGRAPVNTTHEASIFVNKVISYETSIKPNVIQLHESRLKKFSDYPDPTVTPEACAEWIDCPYIINKLYEENEILDKTNWLDAFSDGRLIVQHSGHGIDDKYMLDLDHSNYFHCTDASGMINSFYPIHMSSSCYTGAFDNDTIHCLAEEFILNPNGGTSACIFNSRYGLADAINYYLFTGEFIEQQFYQLFNQNTQNLGKMLQLAKECFIGLAWNQYTTGDQYRWCYYEINLLGDPETPALTTRNYDGPVHNLDKNIYYSTIQNAINDANPGNTIEVMSNVYIESITINKPLTLLGQYNSSTIIDGNDQSYVIYVKSDSVTISGFTIKKGSAGIHLNNSDNCIISNNIICCNHTGIFLDQSSTSCHILNNDICENKMYGVFIGNNSHLNNISNNEISRNNGISGIMIFYSSNENMVYENNIHNNSMFGIWVASSSDTDIIGNYIKKSENYGILLSDVINTNVTRNRIVDNIFYGIYISDSDNNLIYNNYFYNNTNHAYDEGNNIWNISKELGTNIIGGSHLGGNYWDDYGHYDNEGDGLGEIPYDCNGNIQNSYDWLPLAVEIPTVEISKPLSGGLYIFDNLIWSLYKTKKTSSQLLQINPTLIIGYITIEVRTRGLDDRVNRIDIYINDKLTYSSEEESFNWLWKTPGFGPQTLTVRAYDFSGNQYRDEMMVWKFL